MLHKQDDGFWISLLIPFDLDKVGQLDTGGDHAVDDVLQFDGSLHVDHLVACLEQKVLADITELGFAMSIQESDQPNDVLHGSSILAFSETLKTFPLLFLFRRQGILVEWVQDHNRIVKRILKGLGAVKCNETVLVAVAVGQNGTVVLFFGLDGCLGAEQLGVVQTGESVCLLREEEFG